MFKYVYQFITPFKKLNFYVNVVYIKYARYKCTFTPHIKQLYILYTISSQFCLLFVVKNTQNINTEAELSGYNITVIKKVHRQVDQIKTGWFTDAAVTSGAEVYQSVFNFFRYIRNKITIIETSPYINERF